MKFLNLSSSMQILLDFKSLFTPHGKKQISKKWLKVAFLVNLQAAFSFFLFKSFLIWACFFYTNCS